MPSLAVHWKITPMARPCTTSLESPAELCPGTMPDGIDAFHSMSSAATVSKPDPTTYNQTRPSHSQTKPVQCNSHICPPPTKPGKIQPPTTKQHQPAHPQIQLPMWAKFYPISFYKVAVGSPFRCRTIPPTTKSNQHSHSPTKTVN